MGALRAQAVAANDAGRPAVAEPLLWAALDRLGRARGEVVERDRLTLVANTRITLALSTFLLHGLGPGLACLDGVEAIIDELGGGGLRPRLLYQRANLRGRSGDLAGAWRDLRQVRDAKNGFTLREQGGVFLTIGMLAMEMARPREALTAFQNAVQLAQQVGNSQLERLARHNEGYVTYLLGDLPKSLSLMAAVDEIAVEISRETEWLDRARVMLDAGLVSEAVDVLEHGLHSLADGNDQVGAQLALELSRGYRLLGHLAEAAQAASRARSGFARLGASGWETRATLIGLLLELDRWRAETWVEPRCDGPSGAQAGADDDSNAPSERLASPLATAAAADLLTARALELGDHLLADQARAAAAEALLNSGDVQEAQARVLSLRGEQTKGWTGSLADDLNASVVTASVHVASGEPDRARAVLRSSVRRLSASQMGSASLDLRTARAIHGVRLGGLDLDLAVPRGSRAVLESLERWRSATDRLPSLNPPADERLAALTEALRSLRAQQREEADPDVLGQLQASSTRLEREVRARDWALSSSAEAQVALPLRIRQSRDALAEAGCDLVWLFVHRGRLCGVGVSGGRASMCDLMPLAEASELARLLRTDLRAAATSAVGPLTAAVWRSLRATLSRLDHGLLQPWRARSVGLVLITCPEVSALPWGLAPSLVGRPVTIARSLTSFAHRVAIRPKVSSVGSCRVHISIGPGLPRAPHEAQMIAHAWRHAGASVKIGDPSKGKSLVAALSGTDVVHVAAHGVHQAQSPLFSSLSLHDGPVFAHELQPAGVMAKHVVLSACDVGSATFRPGDEQLGMAAAMFSLGAGSVVAAVAPVADDVAAAAMTAHHEGLTRGLASDEALAQAIIKTDPLAAAFLNLGSRFVPPSLRKADSLL